MNYRRSFERDLTSGLHPQRLSINDSVIHHIMHCVVVRSTYTAKRNYRIKIFQFYICLIYLYLKLSNSHSIFNFIISTHVHPINRPSLCRIFSKTFLKKSLLLFITLNILDHLLFFFQILYT